MNSSPAKKQNLWGEWGKRFTNGHKCLNAQEMNALTELLSNEVRKREDFERLKASGKMCRPRNPLAGDATPRTENGDVVLNPNAHGDVANGTLLFVDRPPRAVIEEPWSQGSIGADNSKKQILGNLCGEILKPPDLYSHVQEEALRRSKMAEEARELSESKRRAAAHRQQRLLTQQVGALRLASAQKASEIAMLTKKFGDAAS